MEISDIMKTIVVAGYGWSGSSALVDHLKEYSNIIEPDVEFRLIKDPYGIYDLEKHLFEEWEVINSACAIQDFLKFCYKCYRKTSVFAGYGLNYKEKLNSQFLNLAEEYINRISMFSYKGVNFSTRFKQSALEYTWSRVKNKLAFNKESAGKADLFFSKPDYARFIECTQDFIEQIFDSYSESTIVLLDQAVSPINLEQLKYFRNVKMIVVDRNPYDIYSDMIKNKSLLGQDLYYSHDTEKYVKYHRAIRNEILNKDVLYVDFEELVNGYEIQKKRIEEFIGWDLGDQKEFSLFNPNVSKKNICHGQGHISEKEIMEITEKYFHHDEEN